jgi:hypothetical protein
MGKDRKPQNTIVVENPVGNLSIQVPPQQMRMEIYEPPPPCPMTTLDYQIQQTKDILARIETQQFREDCHLTKEQVQEMISHYTAKFRELLMRRHAARGEYVFGMSRTG